MEKPWEAHKSTAWVSLGRCETHIYSDISLDGQYHFHPRHLRPHIPEAPFDLAQAARCEAVKNHKAPAAPSAASTDGASAGAGAAADGEKGDSAPPPQKKARRDVDDCDGSQ